MCEEFHCRPSQAWQEWRTAPTGLLEDIVELRAYAHAKAEWDRTEENEREFATTPIRKAVVDIDMELHREVFERAKQRG